MARNKEEIRTTFQVEEVAREYDKTRGFEDEKTSLLHLSELMVIKDALRGIQGPVLELAVGTGRLYRNLCTLCSPYVAIDFSLPMLQETRSHLKDLNSTPALLRGDAFSLPFRDGSFSAVLSFRFIMMFSQEDRARIYRELKRVLRYQGMLIFDYRILRPKEKERTAHAFEKLTLSQLRDEIGKNGFTLKRISGNRFGTHHLFPKPLRQSRLFNQAISWLDVRVLNRFPFLLKRCRGGVAICEKR